MTSLVAGIDVGNATTEVVLADVSVNPPRPIEWDRTPTRGTKGSSRAMSAAIDLLHRVERRAGAQGHTLAIAPQHPVTTVGALIEQPPEDTGRLTLLAAGTGTPGGAGLGVGRPIAVAADPLVGEPVVLVARDPLGYAATAAQVNRWIESGARVHGILLAGDEAVLVARRVSERLPIVDGIDADLALSAYRVALEVAEPGKPARDLADPVRLASLLNLESGEHVQAEALARSFRGARDVAVAVHTARRDYSSSSEQPWVRFDNGEQVHVLTALASLATTRGGAVASCALPTPGGELRLMDIADLWGVDLTHLADEAMLRARGDRSIALAALQPAVPGSEADLLSVIAERDGRNALIAASEATAARAGALTTPGASRESTVLDIGAGTLDVVLRDGTDTVLAGAGELLTAAVSGALSLSRGQAEWVKRGPAARVEGPHLLADEDGTRRFLDTPAGSGLVGWLAAPGPAGLMPFSRDLAPAEWRSLRLRLKREVIGANAQRALDSSSSGDVIVVGGPAGDDEVLDALARTLPHCVPGRGNVGGVLGHRYAVAYGLVLLATTRVGHGAAASSS